MSEHSKGPWRVNAVGAKRVRQNFVVDADGKLISHWPNDADAELMAAAPDLLNSLEALVTMPHRKDISRWACAKRVKAKRDARQLVERLRRAPESFPLLTGGAL